MKPLAIALALAGVCAVASSVGTTPAFALETDEAKMQASDAASQARIDMADAFGDKDLKPGQFLWRDVPESAGTERLVVSLSDQRAYVYRGDRLMAVSTISTGVPGRDTPSGIFSVLDKKPFYRSKKYDNAAMPFAEFFRSRGHCASCVGFVASKLQQPRMHSPTSGVRQETLFGNRSWHAPIHRRVDAEGRAAGLARP